MVQNTVKETLVDELSAKIKRDIIEGRLLPGEKIKSKELADYYGTSETPVKLALNRLCMEQIIDNYPRQGMRVHEFTVEEALEIFEIREMMDLYFVSAVIDTVSYNREIRHKFAENVQKNLELGERCKQSMNEKDVYDFFELDYEFHDLYLKCAGNKKLMELYKFTNPYVAVNRIFINQTFERNIEGIKEHRRILDALLARDQETAVAEVKKHYENSKRAVSMRLKVHEMMNV